ncbi:MAG: 3-dehydroquinate synthase [Bacteroidota bacterium]
MISYPIEIGELAIPKLINWLAGAAYSKVMVLTDTNTYRDCYPLLKGHLPTHEVFQIEPGEQYKTLETCSFLWQQMTKQAADRKAVLLNLGGGVIGDMGGFVAGTYKRGIDFVQIPTTLLSQVDASVGGKLGIDFQGYKNHIGLFRDPQGVYIDPVFLKTLSRRELLSGFAEVIKHHLIADGAGWQELQLLRDPEEWPVAKLIRHSIDIKAKIVSDDPFEKGARKALNFGHTIGHALERFFLASPTPHLHGEAIAVGMVAESWISCQQGLIAEAELSAITSFINILYPPLRWMPEDEATILADMLQDKKNEGGTINCTLIKGPGDFEINFPLNQEVASEALAYYRNV